MRLHLIDTDVFIRANREHYGLDYCPAFWDWLGFHGQAGNVGSVGAVLEEIRYLPGAVTSFMSKADYWIVAHALAHGCAVVTHEVAAQTVKKVKIPNACRALGVRCMDPWTMLRMIGARFILDQGGRTVPHDSLPRPRQ